MSFSLRVSDPAAALCVVVVVPLILRPTTEAGQGSSERERVEKVAHLASLDGFTKIRQNKSGSHYVSVCTIKKQKMWPHPVRQLSIIPKRRQGCLDGCIQRH